MDWKGIDVQENFRNRLSEFQQKQADLNKEYEGLRKEVVEQCRELIEAFDLTASELKLSTAKTTTKRVRSRVKYRNPEDETNTWSGIGVAPAWFKAALIAGFSKEDMEVRG